MTVSIKDGREQLYRYDTGRVLLLDGVEAGAEVHLMSPGMAQPLTVTAYADGEYTAARVPDELLARGAPCLLVWVYVTDEDGQLTRASASLPVLRRPKPAGYAAAEAEVKTWAALEERLSVLEQGGVTEEQLAAALAAYLDAHTIPAVCG